MGDSIFVRFVFALAVLTGTTALTALSATGVAGGPVICDWVWLLFSVPGMLFAFWLLGRCYAAYVRKVTFLLDAVENNDYSFRFAEDNLFGKERFLHRMLNRIKEVLLRTRNEVRRQEQFYELILNKSQTGFLVYDEKGYIRLFNTAACNMLGTQVLKHLTHLDRIQPGFSEWVRTVGSDENRIRTVVTADGVHTFALRQVVIDTDNQKLHVLTINDIRAELDEKEIESWIRLTRVLTHEMMNSIAPIRSLSELLLNSDENCSDEIGRGLRLIYDTSGNLIDFVEHYRRFSRLPKPMRLNIKVDELLLECRRLLMSQLPKHIRVYIELPEPMPATSLSVDKGQVMQALINLMHNAVDALQGKPSGYIRLSAWQNMQGRWILGVANNGAAIPAEAAEQIFVPFFTTKERGSGIGLSISCQIMRNHQGSLQLNYSTAEETLFTLCF